MMDDLDRETLAKIHSLWGTICKMDMDDENTTVKRMRAEISDIYMDVTTLLNRNDRLCAHSQWQKRELERLRPPHINCASTTIPIKENEQ